MGHPNEAATGNLWVVLLQQQLKPAWTEVLEGGWARGLAGHGLSVAEMRGWLLHFFPVIHGLPVFLGQSLGLAQDHYARTFLASNIRVQRTHAEHWLAMADGFRVPREQLLAVAEGRSPMIPEVRALTDWLWQVNSEGSLAEAAGATAFAVEGLIGDLARKTINGFLTYANEPEVAITRVSSRWFRDNALFDDHHPETALEVMKHYAVTEAERQATTWAALNSVRLLGAALTASCRL